MANEAPDSMVTPAVVWPTLNPQAAGLAGALRRRLRSSSRESAGDNALDLACAALGIAPTPPAGPLARVGEGGEPDERVWFLAEPVSLVADRDRLVFSHMHDALEEDEAAALITAAREHFAREGMRLERRAAPQWYFSHPAVRAVRTVAPEAAATETFDIEVFHEEGGRPLLRMLNELQMLWHEHPVNKARRAAGRVPANGLWVWDGGRLPEAPTLARRPRLGGGSVSIVGLARWLGLEHLTLEDTPRPDVAPDLVAVLGDADRALGMDWLTALAKGEAAFSLWVRGAAFRVPARRYGWSRWRLGRRRRD